MDSPLPTTAGAGSTTVGDDGGGKSLGEWGEQRMVKLGGMPDAVFDQGDRGVVIPAKNWRRPKWETCSF